MSSIYLNMVQVGRVGFSSVRYKITGRWATGAFFVPQISLTDILFRKSQSSRSIWAKQLARRCVSQTLYLRHRSLRHTGHEAHRSHFPNGNCEVLCLCSVRRNDLHFDHVLGPDLPASETVPAAVEDAALLNTESTLFRWWPCPSLRIVSHP